jgi:heptose II phosphotransferase
MILTRRGLWRLRCVPGRETIGGEIAARQPIGRHCSEVLRDDDHTFVGLLDLAGERIVVKSPRFKDRRPWIRVTTLLRAGHATRLLRFMQAIAQSGVPSPDPIAALERRRWGMVVESWICYRYVPGRPCTAADAPAIIAALQALHRTGWVHGDSQVRNYVADGERIVLIDANPRRKRWGRASEAYDWILLSNSLPGERLQLPLARESLAYRLAALYDRWIHAWRAIKRRLRRRLAAT